MLFTTALCCAVYEVLQQIVAKYQLIMGVKMNQPVRPRVVSVMMCNPRTLPSMDWFGFLEAQLAYDALEPLAIGTTDQEVQIIRTAGGAIQHRVTLPMAIGYPLRVQLVTQIADEF